MERIRIGRGHDRLNGGEKSFLGDSEKLFEAAMGTL
jgi:hypothetical protein